MKKIFGIIALIISIIGVSRLVKYFKKNSLVNDDDDVEYIDNMDSIDVDIPDDNNEE